MSADVEIHLIAYDEASEIIMQVGSNLSSAFANIAGRTQDLVTTTDDATSQITSDFSQIGEAGQNFASSQGDAMAQVGSNLSATFDDIESGTQNLVATTDGATYQIVADYDQVNDAGQNLQNSQSDIQMSTKDTVMSMNNLALSGAALAMSFMMVENRQVAADRANLMVQRSTETLEKAQVDYNTALEQYGAGSTQAQAAADKLSIAQEAHSVALERADMAQRNLSMSMVTAALTVIPSLVSMITIISHATEIWTGLQETLDIVMDANPIFLVVGACAALVAALLLIPGAMNDVIGAFVAFGDVVRSVVGAVSDAWNDFVSLFTLGSKQVVDSTNALGSAVQDTSKTISDSIIVQQALIPYVNALASNTTAAADIIRKFQDNLTSANNALYIANIILGENATTIEGYQKASTDAGLEIKAIDVQVTALTKSYKDNKAELDSQIATLQAGIVTLRAHSDGTKVFTDAENNAEAAIAKLKDQEANLKSQLDSTDKSLADAKAALEAQQQAAKDDANFLTDLTTKYDELQASVDSNLGGFKAAFDDAFNAGDFNKALGIVRGFADQYGLSLSDAEKIIESFAAAQAQIPQSIEQQLLGKAQADFQDFQNCMSGKAFTLKTDVVGHVSRMAEDITNLIAAGLVGEAQSEMQSYVNCNTDKVASMVTQIQTDMSNLTTQHNEQIKEMFDYATTLTGAEKTAVLAQIDQMTSSYMDKMAMLRSWLNELLGQMGADAQNAGASISGALAAIPARIEATMARLNAAMARAGDSYVGTLDDVAAETETATTQIVVSVAGMSEQIIAHAQRLQDTLVGRSIWTDMLTKMEDTTEKSVGKIRGQFQGLQGESLIGGRFGVSEALPGGGGGKAPVLQPIINITIEGNADRATVELTKKEVLAALKSVVVEPTASYASTTQKRIRQGAVTY